MVFEDRVADDVRAAATHSAWPEILGQSLFSDDTCNAHSNSVAVRLSCDCDFVAPSTERSLAFHLAAAGSAARASALWPDHFGEAALVFRRAHHYESCLTFGFAASS